MERIGESKVSFSEPSHTAPFIMTVEREGYLDVDERLLCLHFGIEVLPLLLVEREEYDKDMALMRTIYQRPYYSAEGCHYRVFLGYYKVQQLCPPSASSKTHASSPIALPSKQKWTSLISLSSYQRSTSTQGLRFPTVIENSEFEVLTLSSDSEFLSEGGPDSESTLDRESHHVQIDAKCSEENAPSVAGCQSGVRDIDCLDLSSEMRGLFAVRSKVSLATSVFAKSCGVRTPEFIQPQARVGDLGSGERSECLESPLRSRIVDI